MVHTHCHIRTHRLFTAARTSPVWCSARNRTNECVTGPNQSIKWRYERERCETVRWHEDHFANRTWLGLSLSKEFDFYSDIYIYIYFFLLLYNQKRFFPFTVYPCRMCEETNGKREKREKRGIRQRTKRKREWDREDLESVEKENVYKNEQNGTNTRIQPMRQNRLTEKKMSFELRFHWIAHRPGFSRTKHEHTNKQTHTHAGRRTSIGSLFTYAVQVMRDQVENNLGENLIEKDRNVAVARREVRLSCRNRDGCRCHCHCNHIESIQVEEFEDWYLKVDHNGTYPAVQMDGNRAYWDLSSSTTDCNPLSRAMTTKWPPQHSQAEPNWCLEEEGQKDSMLMGLDDGLLMDGEDDWICPFLNAAAAVVAAAVDGDGDSSKRGDCLHGHCLSMRLTELFGDSLFYVAVGICNRGVLSCEWHVSVSLRRWTVVYLLRSDFSIRHRDIYWSPSCAF